MAEVTAWQGRPFEAMYPVVFFETLRVKIREDAVVRTICAASMRGLRLLRGRSDSIASMPPLANRPRQTLTCPRLISSRLQSRDCLSHWPPAAQCAHA